MKKFVLTLLSLVAIQTLSFGQQEVKTNGGKTVLLYDDGTWLYADSIPLYNIKASSITKLELPKTNSEDLIITHTQDIRSCTTKHTNKLIGLPTPLPKKKQIKFLKELINSYQTQK